MEVALAPVLLVALIAMGQPVGFALGVAGMASLLLLLPMPLIGTLAQKVVFESVSNIGLLTIPMFILMAEFLGVSGLTGDLMHACNRALRRVRGGMAMACVLAGTILAASSGSSTASSATITRSALPAMRQAGYNPSFSLGTIAISGTLAMMIPPSIAFVLYGIMTENSIGKLFLAGVIPGVMTALAYIATISLVLWLRPDLGPKKGAEEAMVKAGKTGPTWPILLLIVIIFGALYSGIASPTEVAAIGATAALVITLAVGRMDGARAKTAIQAALRTTCLIFTIMFSAHMFGYYISFSQITGTLLEWISAGGFSPMTVMLVLVLIYMVLGMLMDQAAIIILTAPISAQLITELGFDPIWWGVIVVKTAEIGMVTPPVGLNVFVTSAAAKVNVGTVFRGVTPFVLVEVLLLGILIAFPELVLLLV